MPIDLNFLVIQLFAGLAGAMILFLLASGLTLIFGVMNILNFAHATMWLLGGYITYSVFAFLDGSGWLLVPAIIAGTAVMALFGFVLERLLISRMYERELPEQLLLTFAMVLIIGDLIKLVWGVEDRAIFLGIEPIEPSDIGLMRDMESAELVLVARMFGFDLSFTVTPHQLAALYHEIARALPKSVLVPSDHHHHHDHDHDH